MNSSLNFLLEADIFSKATNIDKISLWVQKQHGQKLDASLFHGHKFFIECCMSAMFDYLATEKSLGIKSDFLFESAINKAKSLSDFPITCDRGILMHQVYRRYRAVLKSKNYHSLERNSKIWFDEVMTPVLKHIKSLLTPTDITNSDNVWRLGLIERLYLWYNQVNNNGPAIYESTLMPSFWLKKDRLKAALHGYKYILQYLWLEVLGKETFENTSLVNLHAVDSWRDYNYEKYDGVDNPFFMNRNFIIEKQSSLDSYFYRAKDELIDPMKKEDGISIFEINDHFHFEERSIKKGSIGALLSMEGIVDPAFSLTPESWIDVTLYWLEVEVQLPESLHNGIPALISLLVGTSVLHKRQAKKRRQFERVMVCKFVHPSSEGGNDYSFGVLIDGSAATGHGYSGWNLYYDVCGDYSGYSGAEWKKVEEIILEYKSKGDLEIREYEVDKKIFRDHLARYIPLQRGGVMSEFGDPELLDELDSRAHVVVNINGVDHKWADVKKAEKEYFGENISEVDALSQRMEKESIRREKLEKNVIGKARGIILELLAFYVLHRQQKEGFSIDWSVQNSGGEIDVLVSGPDSILLIECKMNLDNNNLSEIVEKANTKLEKFNTSNRTWELWLWHSPSELSRKELQEVGVKFKVVENGANQDSIFRGVNLKQIRAIMDDRKF